MGAGHAHGVTVGECRYGDRNGLGWGGMAKGEGGRITPETARAIVALARDPQNIAAKLHFREQVFTTWAEVMADSESDGHRIAAAEKIMERIDGKVPSTALVGGAPDAAPLRIERVIIDHATDQNPADI